MLTLVGPLGDSCGFESGRDGLVVQVVDKECGTNGRLVHVRPGPLCRPLRLQKSECGSCLVSSATCD